MSRAQAAMEFLLTYGWAILVVIIAIAALAYFRLPIFNIPEVCQSEAGLFCIEKPNIDATKDQISFAMRNTLGFAITLYNLTRFTPESGSCNAISSVKVEMDGTEYSINPGTVFIPKEKNFVVKVNCSDGVPNGKIKTYFKLHYISQDTSIKHSSLVYVTGIAS
ncbi:hypothetical protein DRJ48_04090 [Candidatus Woesearchaeota archaeon]|nr:MAG: hypothetical protein DRJ48_04090 [Candidatus Woesearchaeota archaeon]